jgi:hypothetical protein
VMHNPAAFTSPVDEVVAWGEDTWPYGGDCGRSPPAFLRVTFIVDFSCS